MTTSQKILKYLAIFFAVTLIINIFSGAASLLNGITSLFNNKNYNEDNTYVYTVDEINKINDLKIELNVSELIIKKGETFSVQTNNRRVKHSISNDTLILKENGYFNFNFTNKVIITIPEDKIFNKVKIDLGAGNFNVDDFASLYLDIDAGAGNINANNLSVTEEFEIDGGAGNITILNSQVNNMDLDNGVGEFKFEGMLFGNTEVDMGVGNVTLNLTTDLDLYNIEIDKGIGNIIINNEKIKGDYNNKNIQNTKSIKIDGGVGNISINKMTINSD